MLNLAEYRKRPRRLADYLPWAALIAPSALLCKDGSFLSVARFRGPDVESATSSELVGLVARVNDVLKRFGSGWALYVDATRVDCTNYPQCAFPDAASWLVDEERKAGFISAGCSFETKQYLCLQYLPGPEHIKRGETWLFDGAKAGEASRYVRLLDRFASEVTRCIDLLALLLPDIELLCDGDLLTYLHGTISTKAQIVAVPDCPAYLDAALCDTPLIGGLSPMLGDTHLRLLTLTGFQGQTHPGLLDDLNRLDFPFRWMTRWLPLDKPQAETAIANYRRQWFAKRKSIVALLKETMFNEAAVLTDSDALNKSADADSALQELGSDLVGYGYLTTTLIVRDPDPVLADEKRNALDRLLASQGMVSVHESLNAVEAWLGSIPGNAYANVRQPLVSTLNLAHLMPLSAVWAGEAINAHLQAPCLLTAKAQGATPFRLNLHVGDVGHTLVVGPTGAGKSVLLATLALQFRRYANSQIFILDKGASCRAAVLGMGGRFVDVGAPGYAFQPLARIDEADQRSFALDWVCSLLSHEGIIVDPAIKAQVWAAMLSLCSAPRNHRTLTGLCLLLQSSALRQALKPYTLEGPYGALFDADRETLAFADVQAFELDSLLHKPSVIAPTLYYLFHRLEERFDGRPTLLILDEAWMLLDKSEFAQTMRMWLKTLRKKNVAVVFATQSLSDILHSSIAAAVIESCPTRIFLPNSAALEPQIADIYRRFGLNDRQIELIARALPKRDYYLSSRIGSRLFDLDLGPIALALCASASPARQKQMDEIVGGIADPADFLAQWLKLHELGWAADLVSDPNQKLSHATERDLEVGSPSSLGTEINLIAEHERKAA
jgi:type IV secretion system protein TrbE